MAPVDPAIVAALGLDPATAVMRSHGSSGNASTFKVTGRFAASQQQQEQQQEQQEQQLEFFVKTGTGPAAETMFCGEHASLNAIADAVPDFCPRAHAYGLLQGRPLTFFLATDFLDMQSSASSEGRSFAAKLADLHSQDTTSKAPDPLRPFGFPETTCCGSTPQDNSWKASWADFFADNRLRHVLRQARGPIDCGLTAAVETTASVVVPRLLADGHLQRSRQRGGGSIIPVVVHGDLWSGNHARGRIVSSSQCGPTGAAAAQDVVFDPSCVYGHSEYELGIMRHFGGFGSSFWREYERLVPKDEPVAEWEARVALYELYHVLNHYVMFGGGYRSSAMSIMRKLISNHG